MKSVIFFLLDLLQGLLRLDRGHALQTFYLEFVELHGRRPYAVEVHQERYNPRAAKGWLNFVRERGGLSTLEESILDTHADFPGEVERGIMRKSYKMLLLQAMLNLDALPGSVDVTALSAEFARLACRSARLRADFSVSPEDDAAVRRIVWRDPIEAWTGGWTKTRDPLFRVEGNHLATVFGAKDDEPRGSPSTDARARRLAEYLDKPASGAGFETRVSQSGGRLTLVLPDREKTTSIPDGWIPVKVRGEQWEAEFTPKEVSVMRRQGAQLNELPALLRRWYGPDAGQPGTRHRVAFQKDGETWSVLPVGPTEDGGPVLWKRYSREQIPGLFGLEFNTGLWNQGFVKTSQHIFLLVTLEKAELAEQHQYEDRFLEPALFQWQSQNRTAQTGKDGQAIRNHESNGVAVHLLIRRKKRGPFIYCGDVQWVGWHGNSPITVQWRLPEPVPERLMGELLSAQ